MSNYKHGMTDMSEHNTWRAMFQRCTNPKDKRFKNYGGRGITVCDRWKKFVNFYEDMGDRPKGLTIDRVNNNGNYEKSNCRWATLIEQANNKCLYKNNKTGIAGICWNKQHQKYQVLKTAQGKRVFLGLFTDINEAINTLKTFNEEKEIQCTN